ncbi:unnamed protein product [Vitrella brassicaformis CCMP3155]|uniref:TNase-like domain-containing protein n=1 Tax=Vitrella brassicaformis (strain CCMP3155) TaxID=1169540 RepID=A0A0G4FWH3_VITBC|nr:unnamed protein product [Vitrella brassicaformis CCMP3155]|eukprot:CEM19483.1 unnamed protein product [Vitrella brassicaformis CCMP3155]
MGSCISSAPTGDADASTTLYKTVDDIPAEQFNKKAKLACRVVNVADGDTIRCRHVVDVGRGGGAQDEKGRLRDTTLSIRLYGVDTPETAKFGNAGQPYGEEAKAFVKERLQDQLVEVKLLRRDQYGRAIAAVTYQKPPAFLFFGGGAVDVSQELVDNGLAVIYRGGGAEYNGNKDTLESLEQRAKQRRVNIWSVPDDERVSPGQYKQQLRAQERAMEEQQRGLSAAVPQGAAVPQI